MTNRFINFVAVLFLGRGGSKVKYPRRASSGLDASSWRRKPFTSLLAGPLACLLALAVALPGLTGCATAPSPAVNSRIAILASTAAYVGTAKRLGSHPEDRARFELASQALASLAARADYDPAKLAAIVASLPAVLRSDDALLYSSAAVILWETAMADAAVIDKAPLVKAVLGAIRQGMDRALATQ